MAEIRRGLGGDGLGSERLPWLEPVEDEDDLLDSGGGGGRILLWVVAALIVIATFIGALVYFNRYRAANADIGEVIHAPAGPYKEKPANPGGLVVDESGVIAEKMGTGADIDSPLDLARIPEQPITGTGSDPAANPPAPVPPKPAPAPTLKPGVPVGVPVAPAPAVKAMPAAKPAPTPIAVPTPSAAPPSGATGTIQLGALGSEAKARQVWKTLSTRFGFLAPLAMSITPVKVGDATLYRLRASGGDARKLCAQLKVAGESCNIVD
ncbi:MAG TPA: SPOR domain-containing protein [Sphingomonas sp.]|nr:SPOR domain-containing protein [Sphingomonas sp.]